MTNGGSVPDGTVFTDRLRLEPITPDHAGDLWIIHNDDEVARWYGDSKPTLREAAARATAMHYSWLTFGVHKWIAYHRETGELIGRGGATPTPADDDWGRVNSFLPSETWTREARSGPRGGNVHANGVEIGWALRRNSGARATRPRSAAPALAMRSTLSTCAPLSHAPTGTTSDRGRSWNASG